CFINTETFKLIMEKNKEFADEFMQDMSKNMISIFNRIISLTQKQMAGRVADALVYFSDDIFESRKFDLPLSKQEIADFTKMSKDNVVRIMKSFNDENIIIQSNKLVEIIDYDKLLRICSTG
ncbi:MAG: Crp/Fnr family transcriptional regulator, partial [Cyclobacteriaceae bacterium]|nr:Crp/Fnr family transcriptional regulator [Cyclobacteriaceae bacterium]